jgi:hypothetical protein
MGLLLVAAAMAGAGCGDENRPAVWAYLSPAVFQPTCASVSCHSEATAVAGLDFSEPERGYRSLMELSIWIVEPDGEPGPGCGTIDGLFVCPRDGGRALVTPYVPEQSRLANMLRARNAPRMPPDRPLSEADIRLVEAWILSGARRGNEKDAAVADAAVADAAAADTVVADAAVGDASASQ